MSLVAFEQKDANRIASMLREYESGAFLRSQIPQEEIHSAPIETYIALTLEKIDGNTGGEVPSGACLIFELGGDNKFSMTGFNLRPIGIDAGAYVLLFRDAYSGNYICVPLDCCMTNQLPSSSSSSSSSSDEGGGICGVCHFHETPPDFCVDGFCGVKGNPLCNFAEDNCLFLLKAITLPFTTGNSTDLCVWTSELMVVSYDECSDIEIEPTTDYAYFEFIINGSSGNLLLVEGAGSFQIVHYSADLTDWDCSSPLTLSFVSNDADNVCKNFPEFITLRTTGDCVDCPSSSSSSSSSGSGEIFDCSTAIARTDGNNFEIGTGDTGGSQWATFPVLAGECETITLAVDFGEVQADVFLSCNPDSPDPTMPSDLVISLTGNSTYCIHKDLISADGVVYIRSFSTDNALSHFWITGKQGGICCEEFSSSSSSGSSSSSSSDSSGSITGTIYPTCALAIPHPLTLGITYELDLATIGGFISFPVIMGNTYHAIGTVGASQEGGVIAYTGTTCDDLAFQSSMNVPLTHCCEFTASGDLLVLELSYITGTPDVNFNLTLETGTCATP